MFYVSRTQQITSALAFASVNLSGANFVSERDFTQPEIETVALHAVLFALSDPTRLAIARALADGEEHSAGDLAGDVPKSTMSHHLKILREAGHHQHAARRHALPGVAAPRGVEPAVSGIAGGDLEECGGVGSSFARTLIRHPGQAAQRRDPGPMQSISIAESHRGSQALATLGRDDGESGGDGADAAQLSQTASLSLATKALWAASSSALAAWGRAGRTMRPTTVSAARAASSAALVRLRPVCGPPSNCR